MGTWLETLWLRHSPQIGDKITESFFYFNISKLTCMHIFWPRCMRFIHPPKSHQKQMCIKTRSQAKISIIKAVARRFFDYYLHELWQFFAFHDKDVTIGDKPVTGGNNYRYRMERSTTHIKKPTRLPVGLLIQGVPTGPRTALSVNGEVRNDYSNTLRALRNSLSQGASSPQLSGCHEYCAVRNTLSGCGIMMVTRPSWEVRPVIPPAEPFGLNG